MKLFVKDKGCPNCDRLHNLLVEDDDLFFNTTWYVLRDDPECDIDEDAWVESDMEDVLSTPTLVRDDGSHVTDVEKIFAILENHPHAPR